MKTTKLIVIGSLNTDIVATGLQQFPHPGEHVYGKSLRIGPGGKSRNIADMAAHLMERGAVAMVGRTAKDVYGLWRPPIDALQAAGVLTDFVIVDEANGKMPGMALIAVNEQGDNQIIGVPGANNDFNEEDIDNATGLFEAAGDNSGYLAVTLECPFTTVQYAIQKAQAKGLKVVCDPGGIDSTVPVAQLLHGLFLIKPNEHEVKMITGIEVHDIDSARTAATTMQHMGVANVLITVGHKGAYLFTAQTQKHLPAPNLPDNGIRDETGCGDQTMAALCAYLQAGKTVEEAAEIAMYAGALEFHKQGIQAITREDLKAVL
jgi:ribokinase